MSMEFFVARPPTNNTTNRIVDRTSCERIMNTRDLIPTRYVECRGPQAIVLFGARSKEQAQFTQERPKEKVHRYSENTTTSSTLESIL